ncbi:MAG: acyl-CoA desaturase [Chloroflexi bacterium]|nr:MAG: acyl-CoA desaturase [Chloroflexota bacterium]
MPPRPVPSRAQKATGGSRTCLSPDGLGSSQEHHGSDCDFRSEARRTPAALRRAQTPGGSRGSAQKTSGLLHADAGDEHACVRHDSMAAEPRAQRLGHGRHRRAMSHGWWVDKHNRHHGNPNHQDLDPDIDVGVIAYSEEQALAKTGMARWIVSHQAGLFFPLLFGLAWTMHVSSVRFLVKTKESLRWVEVGALCMHAVAFPLLLVAIVGPWRALLVIVIQKCVGGFYLASVFAPNHKGMPQIESGQELDFLRSQVLTSRNVKSSPLTDLLYGSLNYQIEHHLFPTMPRCNIRRAHKIVRDYCAELAIPYHETTIYRSYQEILSFLHDVGAPLRHSPA